MLGLTRGERGVTAGESTAVAAGAEWRTRRIVLALPLLLATLLAALMLIQLPFGLADNGDFSRIMTWFTSRPAGFEQNWPPSGTEAWDRRFFRYYLPDWQLDFPQTSTVRSSVLLLWWPGVWLNLILYDGLLNLGALSLPARAVLLLVVLGLLRWVAQSSRSLREYLVLMACVGVPFVAMVSTTDYLVLLNSFYQESGSLIFLPLLVLALLAVRRTRSNPWLYAATLAALALLASAKVSNVYWAVLGVPVLASLVPWSRRRRVALIGASLLLAVGLGYGAYQLTKEANNPQIVAFHGLFYGVLTLSERPQAHLQALGLPYDAACLGVPSFDANGQRCRALYANAPLRRDTIIVLAREPLIVPRMLAFVAGQMQATRLEYLGKRAPSDGARGPTPSVLRVWSIMKERFFPRGFALLLALGIGLALNACSVRGRTPRADLAFVGLLTCAACLIDMVVAFLGDGRQELTKHLLLANILFDVALIASLGVAAGWLYEVLQRRTPPAAPSASPNE